MTPLNPTLYDRLRDTLGPIRISNDGVPLRVVYQPDWAYRNGRLRTAIIEWGETYYVSCPFCTDTRKRLAVNHHWAVRDKRTRDDNLQLVKCFNGDCLHARDKQKALHAMVFPFGSWAGRVKLPPKPVAVAPVPRQPSALPPGVPIDQIHPYHPARRYLLARGFSPQHLAHDWDVRYCDKCLDCHPPLREGRIVIPVYEVRGVLPRGGGELRFERHLAGWQARVPLGVVPDSCPKYLTSAGTRKSILLYGLPQAIAAKSPSVIVEGITDVWRVGIGGLALLGKTISHKQVELVVRHLSGRPVIVWLDADAVEEGRKVRDRVRAARAAAGDAAPVLIASTPPGRKDPGECMKQEVATVLAAALAGPLDQKSGP